MIIMVPTGLTNYVSINSLICCVCYVSTTLDQPLKRIVCSEYKETNYFFNSRGPFLFVPN